LVPQDRFFEYDASKGIQSRNPINDSRLTEEALTIIEDMEERIKMARTIGTQFLVDNNMKVFELPTLAILK
jgi:hypothetical protein